MTKQKPIGRMNTGQGVPSDYGFNIVYADGCIGGFCGDNYDTDECCWSIDSNDDYQDENDIYAYQTNRTKAAKFERVECDECRGCGNELEYDGETGGIYAISAMCDKCNGTGRMARRITC